MNDFLKKLKIKYIIPNNAELANIYDSNNSRIKLNRLSLPSLEDISFKMEMGFIKVLEIEFSNVINLDSKFFMQFPNLISLSLISNNIEKIEENTFLYLTKLEELMLGDNEINYIHPNAFFKLSKLKKIYLGSFEEYNNIKSLSSVIFDNLINLQELHLASNKIEELPIGIFKNLKNLKILDISNNDLSMLDNSIFDKLINLEKLFLFDLKLIDLPKSIWYLLNLRVLDLRNNAFNNHRSYFNSFNKTQEFLSKRDIKNLNRASSFNERHPNFKYALLLLITSIISTFNN